MCRNSSAYYENNCKQGIAWDDRLLFWFQTKMNILMQRGSCINIARSAVLRNQYRSVTGALLNFIWKPIHSPLAKWCGTSSLWPDHGSAEWIKVHLFFQPSRNSFCVDTLPLNQRLRMWKRPCHLFSDAVSGRKRKPWYVSITAIRYDRLQLRNVAHIFWQERAKNLHLKKPNSRLVKTFLELRF